MLNCTRVFSQNVYLKRKQYRFHLMGQQKAHNKGKTKADLLGISVLILPNRNIGCLYGISLRTYYVKCCLLKGIEALWELELPA